MRRLVLPLCLAVGVSVLAVPAPATADATPIMGRSVLIADQIAAWFESTGRVARLSGVTVKQLAQLFLEEGAAEGVRGDIAFAQAIFETGYFQFSATVPPDLHNYAGIGAPSSPVRFPDARTGVRAQIQHLRAYADPTVDETGTAGSLVDPRFSLVNPKGQARTVEELSGRWSGGADYGQKVVAVYQLMRDHAGPTLRDRALEAPIIGAAIPSGQGGSWLADRAGGVFALGASFHGSLPLRRDQGVDVGRAPIVAIASTRSGAGYWLTDEAGGIHGFGDAVYFGSLPQRRAAIGATGEPIGAAPVASMAVTPSGRGYWLADEIGGVHTFGDAAYAGSLPQRRAAAGGSGIGHARIIAIVPTTTGLGYWLLDEIGGVHAFGDAPFHGSLQSIGINDPPARRIIGSPSGNGYVLVSRSGAVYAFGDAPFHGRWSVAGLDAVDLAPVIRRR